MATAGGNTLDVLFRLRVDGKSVPADIAAAKKAFGKEFQQIEQLASKPIKLNLQGATGTGPFSRINATLEKGRQEFVASTIKASEAATGAVVSGFIKQNQAIVQNRNVLGASADAHVRYFKTVENVGQAVNKEADAHVRLFKARQAVLPQMDAHVQAFRRIEKAQADAAKSILTLEQTLGKVGGSLRNLGLGLTSLGASLSVGLTAPLAALGTISVRSAVSMDSLNRGLTAIVGSAAEAGVQLKRLTEIAKLPGIGFQEAIQGSIRLQAVGFSAEAAEKALIQFSNAVAITGGGREELARITVQLGQLAAKGKVLAQDLKPIIEAGPAVGRALLQAFGTVNSEDIQALGLSSQEFLTRLVDQLGELPRAAAGAKNTFDNFADAIFRATAAIGEGILPALTAVIETLEPIITAFAAGFQSLPGPIQAVVVVLGALLAAIGPLFFVIGQFSTGIGGLISAFGRLSALGITPSIAGFHALTAAMKIQEGATRSAIATATLARAAFAGLAASLIPIAGLLLLTASAVVTYASSAKEATAIDVKGVQARVDRIRQLQNEANFLRSLVGAVAVTQKEEERLLRTYEALDPIAQARVHAMQDEHGVAGPLADEVERLAKAETERLRQGQAKAATDFAEAVLKLNAQERERAVITATLTDLISERLNLEKESSVQAQLDAETFRTRQQQIDALVARQDALNKIITEQTKLVDGLAEGLKGSSNASGIAVKDSLELANVIKPLGSAVAALDEEYQRLTRTQEEAAEKTDSLTSALARQAAQFQKNAEASEKEADTIEKGIKARVAEIAREAVSLDDARKALKTVISTYPELFKQQQKLLKAEEIEKTLLESIGLGRTKSEDSAAKRRIQILEVARQAAERIYGAETEFLNQQYDARLVSLRDLTKKEIDAAVEVLAAKQKVFDAEREEALKIRDVSKRDLELARIRERDQTAQDEFVSRVNAARERQRVAEKAAEVAHRRALLDIRKVADDTELQRLEDHAEQGFITLHDIEQRRLVLIRAAFAREVHELQLQLNEAGVNEQQREELLDKLSQAHADHAKDVAASQRVIRRSAQETADAFRDYALAIRAAQLDAAAAVRDASLISLTSINSRILLTQREVVAERFAIEKEALNAENELAKQAIDQRERDLVELAKKSGDLEKKQAEIDREIQALRLAQEAKFIQQRRQLREEEQRELERTDPNSTRSLLGDTFSDAVSAIRDAAAETGAEIGIFTETLFGLGTAVGEVFAQMSADAGNFFSIAIAGVGQLVTGIGDLVSQWVLLGETGTASLRRLLAGILAFYAKSFIIKAIDNVAEGFSNIAKSNAAFAVGNVFAGFAYAAAAKSNFIAAAKYGIAGAVTAAVGRATAGDLFSSGGGGSPASAAVSPGAQNREFSYGGDVVESSAAARREGSNNVFVRTVQQLRDVATQQAATNAQLAQQIARMNSMPPGDVVTLGAPGATQAIGAAVIQHSKEDSDFNRDLATNQGF